MEKKECYFKFDVNKLNAKELGLNTKEIEKLSRLYRNLTLNDFKKGHIDRLASIDPLLLLVKGRKGEEAHVVDESSYEQPYAIKIFTGFPPLLNKKDKKKWDEMVSRFFMSKFYSGEKIISKSKVYLYDPKDHSKKEYFKTRLIKYSNNLTLTKGKPLSKETKDKDKRIKKYLCYLHYVKAKKSYRALSRIFKADKKTIAYWIQEVNGWPEGEKKATLCEVLTQKSLSNKDILDLPSQQKIPFSDNLTSEGFYKTGKKSKHKSITLNDSGDKKYKEDRFNIQKLGFKDKNVPPLSEKERKKLEEYTTNVLRKIEI